jgi:hypothetical protein
MANTPADAQYRKVLDHVRDVIYTLSTARRDSWAVSH